MNILILFMESENLLHLLFIIIAELGNINRFNNIKELTAYCGLDPSIKQSGKTVDIHVPISKAGNKYMRKILYIACSNIIRLTAISKQDNDIETYYRKNVMKENIITHQ